MTRIKIYLGVLMLISLGFAPANAEETGNSQPVGSREHRRLGASVL
jgi:hypothetical protein